ncbi:Fringe glycosyltransferase [Pseudolycoriella hygida]|uniref:Fringe glycosyltransferase n=1 Tax=Pseudolycoriella hygida TaxID=35572 RepID=A0A9Q0S3W1_9DIPT|nr:Fringe glycosyltransferase [Pseudolycoriella hygida]
MVLATWFFTDDDDKTYQEKTGGHLMNTNCSKGHFRRALCCKMSVEFDMFLESSKNFVLTRRNRRFVFVSAGDCIEWWLTPELCSDMEEDNTTGAKTEAEDVVCQLLLSLPKSFESVSTALETLSLDKLTLDFVKDRRLLGVNIKFISTNGQKHKVSSSAFATISRKDVTCFKCGRKEHYKNNNHQCKCTRETTNAAMTKSDEEEIPIQF